MKFVDKTVDLVRLEKMAKEKFGNLVKAAVDVEKEVMVIGGELHADEEAELLERGSSQEDIWGVNLYPGKKGKDFIEIDSVINVRPATGNLSRGVEDEKVKEKIEGVVKKLVKNDLIR